MIKNYFKIAWRNLLKSKTFSYAVNYKLSGNKSSDGKPGKEFEK